MLNILMPLYPVQQISDLSQFNEVYLNLFRNLLLRYSNKYDKTFVEYLKHKTTLNQHVDQKQMKTEH